MPLVTGLQYQNLTDLDLDYAAIGQHLSEYIGAIMAMRNFTSPLFPQMAQALNESMQIIQSEAAWKQLEHLDAD